MSASTVLAFTDPDSYATSLRGATAELTITGRGRFEAKLIGVELNGLWMHRFTDNLPRTAHSIDTPGRANITFRTCPGPELRRNGEELLESNIIRRGHAETSFQRSDGFASWGTISLPVKELACIGTAMAGCDLTPPKDALTVIPPPGALERLRRLHEAAGHLAEYAPAVIAHSGAARGLEQACVEALVHCLSSGDVAEDRSALRRHTAIMRKFYEVVDSNRDEALFISDLCAATATSERTLRTCCEEFLNMGPRKYLVLRRMGQARRALREGSGTSTSVTEIAARWGFWNFGRFSVEYKLLFGESPSVTLSRLSD